VHSAADADQAASDADQAASNADQSAADADQTASDSDHIDSTADQSSADSDQRSSDRDQATADRDRAAHPDETAAEHTAYDTSRQERRAGSDQRFGSLRERTGSDHDRQETASQRDLTGEARDAIAGSREARSAVPSWELTEARAPLVKELEDLRAQATADRARAAADRARAAEDRATAARERTRLEAELRSAHLDELTGAYRREMGRLALSHEVDRARRADGRFVVAFVDVDRLKAVNDTEGHAAGDRVLQSVVHTMRSHIRTFDPIIRYGGDEFVCGLSGTDLAEAERRFDSIAIAIEADARVGISVGLAALADGDTADDLTERADAAMLQIKARHHQTG
jgi:diguanylate cyclase (GGDEF)-like protein